MANYQSVTPIKLGQAAITTSTTTLYTVPASTRTYLKGIDVINTSGSTATFNVYLVPAAGTASADNAFYYEQSLTAKQKLQWSGTQILNAGDTVQIKASATGITVIVSGGEAV